MMIELEIISDTYITKRGKQVLFKRNDKVKRLFDINEIDVEEFVDNKTGKHIARYSLLLHNNMGFKINKPYEELKTIVQNRSIPVVGLAAYRRNK